MKFSIKDLIGKFLAKPSQPSIVLKPVVQPKTTIPVVQKPAVRRPQRLQVGFDFGTAYSKLVIRDINPPQIAKVFIPPASSNAGGLPFLIPSVVYFGIDENHEPWLTGRMWDKSYIGLDYPKLALCAVAGVASAKRNVLEPYEKAAARIGCHVEHFVEAVVTFYLARVLSQVIQKIKEEDHGFLADLDDWLGVCVAIPSENLNDPALKDRFLRCLRRAYWHVMRHSVHQELKAGSLPKILKEWTQPSISEVDDFQCSLYPEVSANMVAYTKSRSSREGLFQMIDVGAGTVDVSYFSFVRDNEGTRLSNFSGLVSFCGSSRIERDTCEALGHPLTKLSEFRQKKEGIVTASIAEKQMMDHVRAAIGEEAGNLIHRSVIEMLGKLPNPNQLNETAFLFVGGGNTNNPYQQATAGVWDKVLHRNHNGVANIPLPPDLEAPGNKNGWFGRLTVAYGLSFDPSNRPPTTLPGDHNGPPPVDRNPHNRPSAPSKDEC